MAYGSALVDTITSSGNLTVSGNVVPSGGFYASNTPGRNRFINGGTNIDQRNNGASQTITAAAALAYTVDRWYAYCTGANVTGQRVANTGTTTAPSQYAYQFTGAASVTAIGFAQRIEAVNCFDLAGTTATLSVNMSNSLLTTVTWTAYYANTTDTFGTLASPTKTQIATGTFTVSSSMTRYSTQISVPSAATTGIEIVFSVGAQTSGTWVIGNAQIEAGSMMSVFERRLVGQELSLCQRYCYALVPVGGSNYFLAPGVFNGASTGFIGFNTPQILRTVPSLNPTPTAANYQVYIPNGGAYQTLSSISLNVVTTANFILVNFGIASGGTAGQVCYLSAPSTSVPIIFSAEL